MDGFSPKHWGQEEKKKIFDVLCWVVKKFRFILKHFVASAFFCGGVVVVGGGDRVCVRVCEI